MKLNEKEQPTSARRTNVTVVRRCAIVGCAMIAALVVTFAKRSDVAIAQNQKPATTQPATTTPPTRSLQPRAGRMRQQPLAGAPAPANNNAEDGENDGGTGDRGERAGGGRLRPPPPTTQEREAAFEFVRDYAPNRWQWFNRLPPNSPPRNRIGNMIAVGYRQIEKFKEKDPELYEILRRRVQVQDQAFGIMRRMWRNNYELDADQVTLVREKAAEVVELSLQERERRIQRLEKQLKEQRAKLEADRANTDPLIDAQAKRMKDEAADMIRRVAEIARQNNYPGFPQGMQQQSQDASPTTQPATQPAK